MESPKPEKEDQPPVEPQAELHRPDVFPSSPLVGPAPAIRDSLVEAIPLAAALVRPDDGLILDANTAFGRLLGLPTAEAAGLAIDDCFAPPANRPTLLGALTRTPDGGRWEGQVKKSGEAAWVEVSYRRLPSPQETAVLLLFQDISKQKTLERELKLSKKMDVLGRLTSGIAHDFNNLLTVIVGWSEIACNQCGPEAPLRTHLEEIMGAANRAAAMTRQLLSFSSRQEQRPQELDLNQIVAAMDTMLQRLIGEDIYLETLLDPISGHVKADSSQIEQVIMNLVVNARDAMPHGGKISLRTTQIYVNASQLHGQAVQPGPYVRLTVSDTGHGMDAETQARIFEPFFTTKEPGKGTGLGLSTVAGIIKQLDGVIAVESQVGHGTTFTVYFPKHEHTIQQMERDLVPTELAGGTETILLVEDDPGVRKLIRQTLQKHGYTVIEARHGIEAWMIGSQYADPLHLLLTDVVMPQMSGRAVADRLQSIRPQMKVLYISGHTDDAVFHHGVVDAGQDFLQKPFNPNFLVRKVRDLLDSPPRQQRAPERPS